MLEAEEGDRPMGEVPVRAAGAAGSGSFSMVWKWLQSWVYTAAAKAPSRTEAVLHQFLGRTSVHSPYSLHSAPAVAGSAFAKGTAAANADEEGSATAAALRRASDLLSICSEARRRGSGGSAATDAKGTAVTSRGDAMQDGKLALCRKQYFAGPRGGG